MPLVQCCFDRVVSKSTPWLILSIAARAAGGSAADLALGLLSKPTPLLGRLGAPAARAGGRCSRAGMGDEVGERFLLLNLI